MTWFWLALGAATSWGAAYALSEHVLKSVNVYVFVLVLHVLLSVMSLAAVLVLTDAKAVWKPLAQLGVWGPTLVAVVFFFLGNILVYMAMQRYEVTSVTLIEMSSPLFTALVVWLVFGEMQVTPAIVAGGLLTFAGMALVVLGR